VIKLAALPNPGPIACPMCGFIWTFEKFREDTMFEGSQIQCRPQNRPDQGCGRVFEIAYDGLRLLPDEEAW